MLAVDAGLESAANEVAGLFAQLAGRARVGTGPASDGPALTLSGVAPIAR